MWSLVLLCLFKVKLDRQRWNPSSLKNLQRDVDLVKLLAALVDVLKSGDHEISGKLNWTSLVNEQNNNNNNKKISSAKIKPHFRPRSWDAAHSFWFSPAWLLGWKSLTMIPSCRMFSMNFSKCSSRLSNFSAILINGKQTMDQINHMCSIAGFCAIGRCLPSNVGTTTVLLDGSKWANGCGRFSATMETTNGSLP